MNATAQSTAQNAVFGIANPFGNFYQGLQVFWGLVAALMGGAIIGLIGSLGIHPVMVLGLQVITMLSTILGLFYIISGRPTDQSM